MYRQDSALQLKVLCFRYKVVPFKSYTESLQPKRKSNTFRDRELNLIENNLPGLGTLLNHCNSE